MLIVALLVGEGAGRDGLVFEGLRTPLGLRLLRRHRVRLTFPIRSGQPPFFSLAGNKVMESHLNAQDSKVNTSLVHRLPAPAD